MSDARSEGLKAFADLQTGLKDAQIAFTGLAEAQRQQCQIIQEAADRASRTAVEASEAFAVSKPRLMVWTALCASLLACGALLSGYWLGRSDGWNVGNAAGRKQAQKENVAAAWGNTPSGQLAYRMDQAGLLQALGHCQLSGYEGRYDPKEKRSFCYPTSNASAWIILP